MVYTLGITAILAAIPTVLAYSTHQVSVGANGNLAYDPEYVNANPGDVVRFLFHPKNHTVSQSAFPHGDPCSKQSHGLDSHFQFVAQDGGSHPPTFDVHVKDHNPVWFYCRQTAPKSHCAAGMVFAINPPSHGKNTFSAFKKLALKSTVQSHTSSAKSHHTSTKGKSHYTTTSSAHKSYQTSSGSKKGKKHTIVVGVDGKLAYGSNNIKAKKGDTVVFSFRQKNHTVTQSSFDTPCKALDNGFKSGFQFVAPDVKSHFPTFEIPIKDDKVIWGYCGQKAPVSHCGAGMVFAINAPTSGDHTFKAFQALAEKDEGPDSDFGKTTSTKGSHYTATKSVKYHGSSTSSAYKSHQTSSGSKKGKKHTIVVGVDGKLAYGSNNIKAKKGDQVIFSFRQKNHTVTQSSFDTPCKALDNGFKSGFQFVAPDVKSHFPTFKIDIKDDNVIWGYCGQKAPVSHCGAGMVFAINAPTSGDHTFKAFQALAEKDEGPDSDFAKNATASTGSKANLAGALEGDDNESSGSTSDFKTLMRNAYIIIGLLAGVILMIITLIVVVVTKGKRSSGGSKYQPVVVGGPAVPVFDASKPYSTPY